MGPVSTISRTFQKAIDLVVKPEHHIEDRGRSPSSLRRRLSTSRTSLEQRSTNSPSNSRGRSRIRSSQGLARNGGRPVHLLADSPPGSGRKIIRVPSTRRHSGRRRSLQASLNNKVDTSNPPPVPEMPPRWQEVINAIRGEKKGGPRTEHEEEVRHNFEKLKKKRWDDLSLEEQAKETRNHLENKKRLKAWDLEKDITRQTKKVEQADEEAEEKARAAASAKRRLERLQKRQDGQGISPSGSPKAAKRGTKPKEPKEAPSSDEDPSPDPADHKPEGSNRDNISQQATKSGQATKSPRSSRQVQEYSNSQARPQSHRSSTAPTSAVPSERGSAAPQRPSQNPRSSTAPISAVLSKVENTESRRPPQDAESSRAPSRPAQSEAQASMQQRSRTDAHSNALASSKVVSNGSGAQVPSRTVARRSTTKQILQLSQLRQVSNANEVESSFSRRPASGQSRLAREEESKLQKESQAAIKSSKPSQRQQSASAFEVQTELNRGPGDNMRTIIEGLAPMTPSEIAEEDDKRMDAAREALEEAERREQEKLLVTEFDRGPGNNMRTNLEAMEPMTSEDLRAEDRKWKSRERQQLEAEEEAEQAKLVQTEFNRGLGDMMRHGLRRPQMLELPSGLCE
ncbi:hypothetical protein DL98DRAFT_568532 [Cadophora sp. DSE1049]|nr:hypothetical protein DL98DRAFT_568532 [Cadophora sp. DSE1049]